MTHNFKKILKPQSSCTYSDLLSVIPVSAGNVPMLQYVTVVSSHWSGKLCPAPGAAQLAMDQADLRVEETTAAQLAKVHLSGG